VASAARLVRQNSRELQARLLHESSSAGPDAVRLSAEEVQQAAGSLEVIADLIRRVDTVRRMGHQPGELNHYFYQARGLVLVLASSRHPLTSICTNAGAALAAGNPVVLKPGSRARESGAYLAGLLSAVGLPPDVVGYLPVSGEELGEYLVGHPDVDLITVSGRREVAARVVAVAGREVARDRVKRVVLDVGAAGLRRPDIPHVLQFLEPRVITENTLRRGFAPPNELLEDVR